MLKVSLWLWHRAIAALDRRNEKSDSLYVYVEGISVVVEPPPPGLSTGPKKRKSDLLYIHGEAMGATPS